MGVVQVALQTELAAVALAWREQADLERLRDPRVAVLVEHMVRCQLQYV
jgi:hypothetical protein